MGHFDGDHGSRGRHDFVEHFTAKDDSAELKIVRSRVVSYTPLMSRSL